MSEYFDHYHRWEPLAEFHFCIDDDEELYYDDNNYIYCLCSRVFIRDAVKTYFIDKEEASESEREEQHNSQTRDCDESHVHFLLDTSHKAKCDKDEGASCYCSASHTENYCSTDEHDANQIQATMSSALQPSDSGADLTYHDYHSDYTQDKLETMHEDLNEVREDYFSEDSWDKFWAINGERLIWASWIKTYSDYINPSYLDRNNEILLDDNNIPKQQPSDPIIYTTDNPNIEQKSINDGFRERKFSYDSKVNPYKYKKDYNADTSREKINKNTESASNKEETWLPVTRRRSCSEHDGCRLLSPRTVAGTDSMTNVTKMTFSSYDVSSSHVTSESSPTDEYSVSSSASDDHSNDKTRITNIDEVNVIPLEDLDTEQYWQFLWKKHFGEQYALHHANYIECKDKQNKRSIEGTTLNEGKKPKDKLLDTECENSEGNSQETPTILEVQAQISDVKLEDNNAKTKKKNKKSSKIYMNSVGVLLQHLLKEEQNKMQNNEFVAAAAGDADKTKPVSQNEVTNEEAIHSSNTQQSLSSFTQYSSSFNDGNNDPPEDKPNTLKRSHEIEEDDDGEIDDDGDDAISEKIKMTFEIMGFNMETDKMPKGQLVYRKRLAKLRPPRHKKVNKKIYYDEEGNPYQPQEPYDEGREIPTDDEYAEIESDLEKEGPIPGQIEVILNENVDSEVSTSIIPAQEFIGEDIETNNVTIGFDSASTINNELGTDDEVSRNAESNVGNIDNTSIGSKNSKKRQKRSKYDSSLDECDTSLMPEELKDDPKMKKYWKKRFSLFHRFDEGIKLDRESWFSVTPENVARHIATKYEYDVVLDGFCGAGGNTIQFAKICNKVIAIDIDPLKIEMAKHNAEVYGVADQIEFIVGDFFELAPQLKADMVFLSPPWGGPKYTENKHYDLETMLEPKSMSELVKVARTISTNVTIYLPRNSRSDQILNIAKEVCGSVEIEQNYLDRRFVAITAYYYNDN